MEELLTLGRLQVSGRPSKAPRIIEVIQQPSLPDWVKVNTDGAAFGATGLVGCGLFCNCRDFIEGCFTISLCIESQIKE